MTEGVSVYEFMWVAVLTDVTPPRSRPQPHAYKWANKNRPDADIDRRVRVERE